MFKNILVVICLTVLISGFNCSYALAKVEKKALVVASFGTTFHETLKEDIGGLEQAIAAAFPDRDFKRAFTSNIIRTRLAARDNIVVDDLKATLEKLAKEGYTDVLVQTTLLTPMEEYANKILPAMKEFGKNKTFTKLMIGEPLFMVEKDYELVAKALKKEMPKARDNFSVVFMGHGSPNRHNPAYDNLQKAFDKLGIAAVTGVVEDSDHPNFEDTCNKLKARNIKEVFLMPLMIVAGDHANNDMMGEEEDSWKHRLEDRHFTVVGGHLGGIGRLHEIQKIYIDHAKKAKSV